MLDWYLLMKNSIKFTSLSCAGVGLALFASAPNRAYSQPVTPATSAKTIAAGLANGCPPVTKVRFFPRKGQASRMERGRFTGSNDGATTGFQTIADIKGIPPEDKWSEITLEKPVRFRFLKYESSWQSWGNVAEVEFWSGDRKIAGTNFGTNGSRDNSGNDFSKALDGDVDTFFDGVSDSGQYAGIDLGAQAQAAAPVFSPPPGSQKENPTVAITSTTPNAKIRFTTGWGVPSRENGEEYKAPVELKNSAVLAAVAFTDNLAASPVVLAPYRVGTVAGDLQRTFHIGNSLTDSTNGLLEPLAQSGGKSLEFHRFTIPGAPTDWLWDHPGSGFGDGHYLQAFQAFAPIAHVFTQPFAGHDRSIENEAEYSRKFFDAALKHSPQMQAWLYVQWPNTRFDDSWSQAKGSTTPLKLKPATTWQQGVANHVAYTEAVRDLANKTYKGAPIRIVPAGLVLANLRTEIEAGRVAGISDFVKAMFDDDLHLSARGRYAVALAHYACIYGESPEGKVSPLASGLTPEQAKIFARLTWDTVKNYPGAGLMTKATKATPTKVATPKKATPKTAKPKATGAM